MRRDNLDFQIFCFNRRKLELLIWVFEKPDVLRLKFVYRFESSSSRIISRQQLELFQIPALATQDQYLECIEACRLIIFESVNGPTADNAYIYVLPKSISSTWLRANRISRIVGSPPQTSGMMVMRSSSFEISGVCCCPTHKEADRRQSPNFLPLTGKDEGRGDGFDRARPIPAPSTLLRTGFPHQG